MWKVPGIRGKPALKTTSRVNTWICISLVLGICCIIEAIFIIGLVSSPKPSLLAWIHPQLPKSLPIEPQSTHTSHPLLSRDPPLEGVAITLWLGSPQWFQNRYTMMLALVHAYLPKNWKIQVFYHPEKDMALKAIQFVGVQKLIDKGALILTPLPSSLTSLKPPMKRKDILVSRELWSLVAAEKVITFGGTSVLCGNSPVAIEALSDRFDYIGGPWAMFDGVGGDAGLTYRNRTMMQLVTKALQAGTHREGREDVELMGYWKGAAGMAMATGNASSMRLASRQDTLSLAMSDLNGPKLRPLGAIGTLAGLSDELRTQAIEYCPELKLFYPVLSHPSCFGASPKPIECFKFLCESGGLKCDIPGKVRIATKRGERFLNIASK